MKKPVFFGEDHLRGGRTFRGGTEHRVIVANPSGWTLRSQIQPALAARFGERIESNLRLLDDELMSPVERMLYHVEYGHGFQVEASRRDARPHAQELVRAYASLVSWDARGRMYHLLMDQSPDVLLPLYRDALSGPVGEPDSMFLMLQVEAVMHFGGHPDEMRWRLESEPALLASELARLKA